jgi:3-(3-hydroxy-phenyl)propionate hydroxylase
MPDLEIETAEGQERLYTHLREARPVLLNLDCPGSVDAGRWSDYIRTVEASYGGTWNLPVTGAVSAPSAVLIRPDGYVAWVGQGTHAGLVEALTAWFGRR